MPDSSLAERKAAKAAYDLARRQANPERKRAQSRAYYLANRERKLAQSKANAAANRERMSTAQRAWRARNPERAKELERARRRANPHTITVARQRYRAAKKRCGGGISGPEWLAILAEFDHRCAYCSADGPLQMEHMTPLSRGGLHTTDNVVPACGSCNRRKGALTALEFLQRSTTISLERGDPA